MERTLPPTPTFGRQTSRPRDRASAAKKQKVAPMVKSVGKALAAGKSPLTFEPLGIAMPEDTLLINWVQNFLVILEGSGELKKMHEKWLRGGSWIEELP